VPRVAVITCCWNSEAYVGRTIESVLAQTFSDWEQVVVDDGSPGDIVAAVGPHMGRDPRIQLVRQRNGGLCNARNAGYHASSPECQYVLFLDADDCMEPDMLRVLVAELDNHPEAGMAFCDRTLIDAHDRPIRQYAGDAIPRFVPGRFRPRRLKTDEPETPFVAFFAYSVTVPSLTLLRRSTFEKVGTWDESLAHYDDTDMWLRVTLQSTARYVPQHLLRRRIHGEQLTRSPAGESRRRESVSTFDKKWRDLRWLDDRDRQQVAEARRFRDGMVMPYLWFAWAKERLRRRHWFEALRCTARGLKQLGLHGPPSWIASRYHH
jgi:glycosyltransferase involved in cell wall biosynthesis